MSDGLRDRLVASGVELVAREGAAGLGLREIARAAGVSHGAPRRYFATHRQLLAAIAREGYATLSAEVAAIDATGPRDRVLALGRVYLGFARSERGMFELMFRHDLLEGQGERLREAALPLFAVLVDLLRAVRPEHAEPELAAGALWAALHGIAQLGQWRSLQLATGGDDLDGVWRAAVEAHLGPA